MSFRQSSIVPNSGIALYPEDYSVYPGSEHDGTLMPAGSRRNEHSPYRD